MFVSCAAWKTSVCRVPFLSNCYHVPMFDIHFRLRINTRSSCVVLRIILFFAVSWSSVCWYRADSQAQRVWSSRREQNKHHVFNDSWKACPPKKMALVVPTRRCEFSVDIHQIGSFASWSLTFFLMINISLFIVVGLARNTFCRTYNKSVGSFICLCPVSFQTWASFAAGGLVLSWVQKMYWRSCSVPRDWECFCNRPFHNTVFGQSHPKGVKVFGQNSFNRSTICGPSPCNEIHLVDQSHLNKIRVFGQSLFNKKSFPARAPALVPSVHQSLRKNHRHRPAKSIANYLCPRRSRPPKHVLPQFVTWSMLCVRIYLYCVFWKLWGGQCECCCVGSPGWVYVPSTSDIEFYRKPKKNK